MSDRTVHATNRHGTMELVRYDRAGKWYIEPTDKTLRRQHVNLRDAVGMALFWWRDDGCVFFGKPGGKTFDAQFGSKRRMEDPDE